MNSKGERDLRHFNRWSRKYDDSWQQFFFTLVHRRLLALVALDDPATILDVGCGTGRLLRRAGARWPDAQLIGVDPAEGMLEVARRKTIGAKFHLAGSESLPLASASVDLALSSISFHHWPDQLGGLRQIARVLRPGGQFCLADPAMPAWMAKLGRSYARSRPALRTLFADVGLDVLVQHSILLGVVFATVGVKN